MMTRVVRGVNEPLWFQWRLLVAQSTAYRKETDVKENCENNEV